MVKNDIIIKISKDKNITKKDAEIALDNVIEAISDIIISGEEVYINGFGKFIIANRKPRQGRNPKTGEVVDIPASKKIKFSPSKNMAEEINK